MNVFFVLRKLCFAFRWAVTLMYIRIPLETTYQEEEAFAGTVKQITIAALLLCTEIILFLSITCQSNAPLQQLVPR
jgi:hypothetical protein